MISLQSHDRMGRSSVRPDISEILPGIDERAAIARRWAASTPAVNGVRRTTNGEMPRPMTRARAEDRVATIVAPVIDALSLGAGDDIAGLRAFAARMLSRD